MQVTTMQEAAEFRGYWEATDIHINVHEDVNAISTQTKTHMASTERFSQQIWHFV
jgi:hypothetical protein